MRRCEKRKVLYQLLFLHLPLHLFCLFHRARFRTTERNGRTAVDRPRGASGDFLALHGLFGRVECEVDGAGTDDGGEYVYSGNERERGEGACEGVCVVGIQVSLCFGFFFGFF